MFYGFTKYSEYGTSTDPPEPHIAATLQLGSPVAGISFVQPTQLRFSVPAGIAATIDEGNSAPMKIQDLSTWNIVHIN